MESNSIELQKTGNKLKWGFFLNSGFLIVEFIFGVLAGSLALIADAGHNLVDSFALLIAWSAVVLSRRSKTEKMTFGYQRFSVMAAFLNSFLMILIALFIFYQAYQRIINPQVVDSLVIIWVAALGFIINLSVALILRKKTSDLNLKTAFIFMLADALVSLGVVIAGLIIYFSGAYIVDPIISIVIGIFLIFSIRNSLKESFNILTQAVPKDIDLNEVENLIVSTNGVLEVHDIHVWSLGSDNMVLSCHIKVEDCNIKQASEIVEEIKYRLKDKYKLNHATIETEFDKCVMLK